MNNKIYSFAAAMMVAALVAGCGRQEAAHDHENEKEEAHADHDGHGHEKNEAKSGHDEHGEEITLTPEGMKKSGVRVVKARKQQLIDVIQAPGRVTFNAEKMAHVGAPVSGRVAEIKARVGDQVKAGDVLMSIQSPQLGEAQSAFLLKRLAAEAAGPAVDVAKASYERAKNLHAESEGITLAEVQKREAEYKAAQSAQKLAQAEMAAAEHQLHLLGMDQTAVEALIRSGDVAPRYLVRAPMDGTIVEREVTLGEQVNSEREALAVIADMSRLWILADVPESRLSQFKVDGAVEVTVPGSDQALPGKVTFIAPAIQAETRTASVCVEIENSASLRPGMFVQVALNATGGDEHVLAIPEESTQLVEGETVVFVPVEGEPNTFAKRPIQTGPAVGRMLPVLKGLIEGERYVSSGSFILKAQHGKGSAGHEH